MLPLVLFLWIATSCSVPCEHGHCNNSTLECVCQEGWEGADCAVEVVQPFTTAQGWFFLVVGLLTCCFFIVMLGLLMMNNFVATRYPQMVVISSLLLLLINSSILLKRVRPGLYSCSLNFFLFTPVLGTALWTMFLRTYFIYRLYNVTAARVLRREQLLRGEDVPLKKKCCPIKLSENVMFLLGMIVLIVLSVLFSPFTVEAMSFPTMTCNHFSNGITVVMLVCLTFSWIYLYCRLRKIRFDDAYHFKKEFQALTTIAVALVVAVPISICDVVKAFSDSFSFTALVVEMGVVGLIGSSACYPLSKLHLPHYEIGNETIFLKDVLHDQPNGGREAFWSYLVSEFKAENMMLFEAIERFQAMHVAFGRTHPGRVPERRDGLAQLGVLVHVEAEKPTEDELVKRFIQEGVDEEKLIACATNLYNQYIATGALDRVKLLSIEARVQLQDIFQNNGRNRNRNNQNNNNNNNNNNNQNNNNQNNNQSNNNNNNNNNQNNNQNNNHVININDNKAAIIIRGSLFDKAKEELETDFRRVSFPRFCCSPLGQRYKLERGIAPNIQRSGLISHFAFLTRECVVSFFSSLCSL